MRLEARSLSLTMAGRKILDAIDLSAAGGEFIAVIGPNGAGKSTLLRLIAGLGRPDAGAISLDGRRLEEIEPRELACRRAYLPQNPRCDWPLPVRRLVGLGLTPTLPAMGDFSAADQRRIEAVLESCDLWTRRDQSVNTLSGGELARAMLARALVADPELLIIDEPLAGLDPRHSQDAVRRLGQLAREGGKLVIAAMHDLNVALRSASRVWALQAGRLIADGAPRQVLTPELLRSLFDIEARIEGTGARALIDFSDAR